MPEKMPERSWNVWMVDNNNSYFLFDKKNQRKTENFL